MRDFKFFQKDNRIYHEGREVVYVGYLLYNPESFDALRRVQLRDEEGSIKEIQIDADHPLWNEVMGMEGYSI